MIRTGQCSIWEAMARVPFICSTWQSPRKTCIWRQMQVFLGDCQVEQIKGTLAIASHIEHWPVRIIPIGFAALFEALFVSQFQPPEDFAAEVSVIEDLNIVGTGPSLKQQAVKGFGLRLARRILFTFT